MIFSEDSIQKILSGKKTMTRRLVKDGELDGTKEGRVYSSGKNNYLKWVVGHSYAVCPDKGKSQIYYCPECNYTHTKFFRKISLICFCGTLMNPLFIKITSIRKEKLNEILNIDAKKEGFKDKWEFLYTFCEINKKKFKQGLNETAKMKNTEPHWNPDVWVLSFKVIK